MKRTTAATVLLFGAGLCGVPLAPVDAWGQAPIKTEIRDRGFVGDLYTPAGAGGRKLPAIIELGGSEGGLGASAAHDATLLSEHGYVVLQLAYFDASGLPKELGLVPLEYFGTAIAWLRSQPNVDPDKIGIEGTSVGGEVALVVASHFANFKAVVASVPSSVVWPGISHTSASPPSTFSLDGKPLPFLPYGWNGPKTSIYDLYALGLKALDQHPDAIIPVERIGAPVMLICGESDSLWPSCPMVDQVSARLKAHAYAYPVHVLKYADAGHASFGPPAKPQDIDKLAQLGGSGADNQAARLDDWPKMLAFMDAALK